MDFNSKKGFICDMDGVIYHGNKILPGVPEFIEWLKKENKEYLFLTNNSGSTPRELQQKLARMGLDVPEKHFYTSAKSGENVNEAFEMVVELALEKVIKSGQKPKGKGKGLVIESGGNSKAKKGCCSN